MAGIIHGKITTPDFVDEVRKPVPFATEPTPIKSIWIQVPVENAGAVHVGGVQVSFGNSPAIVKGSSKDFIFKHDAKESPGDLSDFYALFRHGDDELEFLAITT